MKQITVSQNEAGQRMDKLLAKLFINSQKGFLYKMLRKKNITLNGKRAEGNEILNLGDVISVFFSEETFEKLSTVVGSTDTENVRNFGGKTAKPGESAVPEVVYEDKDVIVFNKPAGVLSQKAEPGDYSLTEYLVDYLMESGSISREQLKTFRPGVCNRLDRNTSGLIAAGKSLYGLQSMSELIRSRTLTKLYLCVVKGSLTEECLLDAYLVKNERTNKVSVSADSTNGEHIRTRYRPLAQTVSGTLLEVELITGKSHQIRAHLSSIGHPIAGDVKYGDKPYNERMHREFHVKHQMLHAWRMVFPDSTGVPKNLRGRVLQAALPKEFTLFLEKNEIVLPASLC